MPFLHTTVVSFFTARTAQDGSSSSSNHVPYVYNQTSNKGTLATFMKKPVLAWKWRKKCLVLFIFAYTYVDYAEYRTRHQGSRCLSITPSLVCNFHSLLKYRWLNRVSSSVRKLRVESITVVLYYYHKLFVIILINYVIYLHRTSLKISLCKKATCLNIVINERNKKIFEGFCLTDFKSGAEHHNSIPENWPELLF